MSSVIFATGILRGKMQFRRRDDPTAQNMQQSRDSGRNLPPSLLALKEVYGKPRGVLAQ